MSLVEPLGQRESSAHPSAAVAAAASFYDKTRWKKDPKYPLICGFLFIHATLHTTFASILSSMKNLALPLSLSSNAEEDERFLASLISEVDLQEDFSSKKQNGKGKKKKKRPTNTPKKSSTAEKHEHIDLVKEKAKKMVVEIAQRYEHWKSLHLQHSTGEDTVIFPALMRALPSSNLTLSSHEHGHKEQERRMRYIEAIFKGMINNPSEILRKQLVQAMQALSDDQESHYREEENDIVPKCLAHLSPQQLGPLVPQILNDYRLYKTAIQLASPMSSTNVEKKLVSIKNQDREEQEAILNDLTFLEEKRNGIMQFWINLSPRQRSDLLVIDHPMLVDVWSKKLAHCGRSSNNDSVHVVQKDEESHLELSPDFFSIVKHPYLGSNVLQLGTAVVSEGTLLFSVLDHLTGNLFLRAPLFQIFRRLLTPSANASSPSKADNAAQEMLLIFEIERLLRLGHRNASEALLLNQVVVEQEEQRIKEELKRKKNQKKRQKQKEKEKLHKQILQKKCEEEREEAERKQKQEEAIILLKTEERRQQERLRHLRKQARLKKLINLMEELKLQHNIQHKAIEDVDDNDIEFDDETDEDFSTSYSDARSSVNVDLEISISDDEDEDEDEESFDSDEEEEEEAGRNKAVHSLFEEEKQKEFLEEELAIIYRTTDKILNDHARNVAIRQFYSPSNYLQLIHICLNPVDQIFALYQSRGNTIVYHKYSITHLQHALQCATLAEKDGAQATEIASAFLHDIGCLLFADTTHDQIGCEFLSQCGFKNEVTQPILWHEVYEDEEHYEKENTEKAIIVRKPLERQTEFSKQALALMKRDKAALDNTPEPYDLEHFRTYLEQCLQRFY